LEIVSKAYVDPFIVDLNLLNASLMIAKTMMREGCKYGKRLGKDDKDFVMPLEIVENKADSILDTSLLELIEGE